MRSTASTPYTTIERAQHHLFLNHECRLRHLICNCIATFIKACKETGRDQAAAVEDEITVCCASRIDNNIQFTTRYDLILVQRPLYLFFVFGASELSHNCPKSFLIATITQIKMKLHVCHNEQISCALTSGFIFAFLNNI
jgi:hypothetical protein